MPLEIKVLKIGDEHVLDTVKRGVFDGALDPRATKEFLSDPRHHLAVALDDASVVGFASAVHYVHPDKQAPEMWINEVGVAPSHRGRGVGKAILESLLGVARNLGCAEAWVLTNRANEAAVQLYKSCGGVEAPSNQVMFRFRLSSNGR